MKRLSRFTMVSLLLIMVTSSFALASEANLKIPQLEPWQYMLLLFGIGICFLGLLFGYLKYREIKKMPALDSLKEVSNTIYETCKSYLYQQGKFLAFILFVISAVIGFYYLFLMGTSIPGVLLILGWTVVGIGGSYGVAWFGIRVNTLANSRMAHASLLGKPIPLHYIPLSSGMSIGVILISVELLMMLVILLTMPLMYAGACFVGFAIGESLGATVLRVGGGIFTKIADIGADLMKIDFKLKEDDPRNPGVIADCTGDNAGDSIGPTADGFETYGVTGVAIISFIVLAVSPQYQVSLLTWIFSLRILMVVTSICSYWLNDLITKIKYKHAEKMDYEKPLTSLIWITSAMSIGATFIASYFLLKSLPNNWWLLLSIVISCGTLGAALIPEFTKIFTSTKSKHVNEIVNASRKGGPSLNILSGLVAGNFSAFWLGMVFCFLMLLGINVSQLGLGGMMIYPSIFTFGLIAFGFLGMGPVTIAVDSYGPVTDNAQSVFELGLVAKRILAMSKEKLIEIFGLEPDVEKAKDFLEDNDGAGNTFKATSKPVLIGTAVVGATIMIFSLVLIMKVALKVDPAEILTIINPYAYIGLIAGVAVIYWFTGATIQAVVTGSYRAVEFIREKLAHIDKVEKASVEDSKRVVKICTQYSQKGMINIFCGIFSFTLAFAFFSAPGDNVNKIAFFVFYLVGLALGGLFQAVFMANAGGAWDNAKKIVESHLKQKNTPLHEATIIGDTVGDPYKDTSSVSMNPVIKFSTLFGLIAMDIAIQPSFYTYSQYLAAIFFASALFFVFRSFYKMRIEKENKTT